LQRKTKIVFKNDWSFLKILYICAINLNHIEKT